jgi:hypothetical protein
MSAASMAPAYHHARRVKNRTFALLRPAACRNLGAPSPEYIQMRRKMTIAQTIGLLAVLAASVGGGRPAPAAQVQEPALTELTGSRQSIDPDLVLVCPKGRATEPELQDPKTGKIFAINNPRLRAVAKKACQPGLTATQSSNVNIVNNTGKKIYVGFSPQAGSAITWGPGCGVPIKALTVPIASGATCQASVTNSVANPGSRFCAATSAGTSGLDCSVAQQNNQTLVETLFQPAPCFGPNSNCIWYDISVIPTNCTDAAWSSNFCKNTGGAAYNIPVSVSCTGEPKYTCQGPPFTSGNYAAAGYPSKCGNPLATCFGDKPSCVNAYFWPMFGIPQPNSVCPNGQTLTITFLAGP